MSDYQWPDPATRPLLGKKISRVDGPVKVSGRAKYTYDYNPAGSAGRQDPALSLRARPHHQHRHQRRGKDGRGESCPDHSEAGHGNLLGGR